MKMKRFAASLLAICMLVMACSTTLAGTAFALSEGNGAEIRISNVYDTTGLTLSGRSFNVYEIFTATIGEDKDKEGNQVISYDVSEDFVVFFLWIFQDSELYKDAYGDSDADIYYSFTDYDTAYKGEGDVALADLVSTVMKDNDFQDNAYAYVEAYENDMATFVDELRYFVLQDEYGISPLEISWTDVTTVGTTQSIMTDTNASLLGYYLVLDSADTDYYGRDEDTSTSSVIMAGALATVPSRHTDGTLSRNTTIYIKGSAPTLTKEVWHNDIVNETGDYSLVSGTTGSWDTVSDYQIGDTVEFRLTASIPSSVDGYESYTYIITDTPEDGIIIDLSSIAIYTDAALSETTTGDKHEVIDHRDGSFSISFDMIEIYNMLNGAVSEFYIYYTATIDQTAIISMEYETNTATLEYSTNPYDKSETNIIESDVYVYTFDLDVLKTSADEVSPLADATFALYEMAIDGSVTKTQLYIEQLKEADGTIIYGEGEDGEEIPIYYIATGKTASDIVGSVAGTITTDNTGRFTIIGLDDATTYVLTEIDAPDGYNAADPISFTIGASYTYDTSTGTPILNLSSTSGSEITASGNVLSTTIVNTSSAMLPSTGGMGTTLLTYGGIILMVGAGTALLIKRKKS